MVNLKINDIPVQAEEGSTILEAAIANNIYIPTLCYLKDINKSGACRMCLVEVSINGRPARGLGAACVYPVAEGMEVKTNTEKVINARRNTLQLLMSNHSKDCLACIRNQHCELQKLCEEMNIREVRYKGATTAPSFDDMGNGIMRDTTKCVLCGRCIETCKKVQGLGVLGFINRGFKTIVGPIMDHSFAEVNCMQCGQCVVNCPVGALAEKEEIHNVVEALNDPDKYVICQTAPSVRASLGEEFGMPIGSRVTGKMCTALHQIGFDRVYDTNFGADLTIMEEGYEFMSRVKNKGVLPQITSCSPGWIRYMERNYADLIPNVSTCKSPHMMFGAILKSYFAQVKGIDPKKIYNVSIMPCTAKKDEKARPVMEEDGVRDVDAVLTTRELGRLIKMYGIDFTSLPDGQFDQEMFGDYSGAGVIFGASGGVMEAALRTVADVMSKENGGQPLTNIDYEAVRGPEGVKTATVDVPGVGPVKVAVANSMHYAKPLLDEVRAGKSPYAFIEIMGCPGGCVNGGGQSIIPARIKNHLGLTEIKKARAKALYDEDKILPWRKSHDNPQIQELYKNFLGEPLSEKSEKYLHTTYSAKKQYTFTEE